MIVQCATFSKSLNSRNIRNSVSDILIRIQLPFESSLWISLSSCKLTILPHIQPAIMFTSSGYDKKTQNSSAVYSGIPDPQSPLVDLEKW